MVFIQWLYEQQQQQQQQQQQHFYIVSGYHKVLLIPHYILTIWGRVHRQKLTGPQLVKKFLVFYWTRRFITAFTSARHLSLSWDTAIHSMSPHHTPKRPILILSSYLRLGLPTLGSPHQKPCMHVFCLPYMLRVQSISFFMFWSAE